MTLTSNNNGQSYVIAMDTYKEGPQTWDISDYIKARVGDNGLPFKIHWFEHGQIKDVTGLKPFIRGKVGQYSIDSDNKVVMADNATSVDVTGSTDDCEAGGYATYRLISQALPQEGIFYGTIGLKKDDTNGTVETGVDIWFTVLADRMNMGEATSFYVSELDKAIINIKATLNKTINDINERNQQETKDTTTALEAVQTQVTANQQTQATLTNQLNSISNEIKSANLATKPDLDALSNKMMTMQYIQDSTDIHSITKAGLYYANNVNGLQNSNGANTFGLLVLSNNDGSSIHHTMFKADGSISDETFSNNSWSGWINEANMNSVNSLKDQITTINNKIANMATTHVSTSQDDAQAYSTAHPGVIVTVINQ